MIMKYYLEIVKIIDLGCSNTSKEGKDNNKIIKKRYTMPTIGNISFGKSYSLNSLLGLGLSKPKMKMQQNLYY